MSLKTCQRCGAYWINDQHRWATGAPGNELDLAGLVCNVVKDTRCINPRKGEPGGQTFESRTMAGFAEAIAHGLDG